MLNNKTWWKAAFVRALRTVAQTAVATIGTAALIERVNWLAGNKNNIKGRRFLSSSFLYMKNKGGLII